ncbi:hypothetical protein [Caballeronia zhejiangensis]|uniref:hypothetical protein n=1 Tax=Caballeronia zhejiangensis TaxID=871203 RepID=UPI0015899B36|nr:hypothetical protein [Caballeronia zhejiangensis]MCI1042241.1 hypothetical protein [Caballeronia zhejiangensis]
MTHRVFIVQDRESAQFLFPDCGDVGLTAWINEAGLFESEEAAIETAFVHCTEGFIVFEFIEDDPL